jgi:GTPase SAR1 family protein
MEVELWDTVGQQECRSVDLTNCRDVFVFDVNNDDSFLNIPSWVSIFRYARNGQTLVFVNREREQYTIL